MMKKRVADIVVETLLELGISECFCVVGGGAMHLNNAFKINEHMHVTYCHHEQACAFAAEGYAKYSGAIAAVSVTSGPGAVNTLNGVYSAWVDSTPMIVIAGHPRLDTTVEACGLNLRCRGVQEYNIIPSVTGMTKYAVMITDPATVKSEIIKAYNIAMSGRRGPVWISIPLDIQALWIEEPCAEKEMEYEMAYEIEYKPENVLPFDEIIQKLRQAERPCILAGSAIRFGGAMEGFLQLLDKLHIPIVGGALLSDILPEGFPLYYGLSGNIGPRAGNFILQNADVILVLGNSLSARQTGYNVEKFAPDAYFIMVDAESDEMKKPDLHIDLPVQTDLKTFFAQMCDFQREEITAPASWIHYCEKACRLTAGWDEPEYDAKGRVPAKLFWKIFREKIAEDASIALGNSNCVIGIFQYGVKEKHQRVITNYNAGSMGYDLPEAVGVAIASGKEVYCVTGDGSIMMNLQELQTIKYNQLPVKIVVFSNEGYGAIRQTCQNYFKGVYTGCDYESGISFPGFEKIAETFGFDYIHCASCDELEEKITCLTESKGQVLLEVEQLINDPVTPKVMSIMNAEGKFETPDLTEMSPLLPAELRAELSSIAY